MRHPKIFIGQQYFLIEGASLSTAFRNGASEMVAGAATGAVTGGVMGGVQAHNSGQNIWTEKNIPSKTIGVDIGGKPLQKHHYATNKHSEFTPQMESIVSEYGLSLNDSWNIKLLPHMGRHPTNYHKWVLEVMTGLNKIPGMNCNLLKKSFKNRLLTKSIATPICFIKNIGTNINFNSIQLYHESKENIL